MTTMSCPFKCPPRRLSGGDGATPRPVANGAGDTRNDTIGHGLEGVVAVRGLEPLT